MSSSIKTAPMEPTMAATSQMMKHSTLVSDDAPNTESMIWPQGVGLTDRYFEDPEECSRPHCCNWWTRPIWFASSDLMYRSPQASWRWNVCIPGFAITNADVLGQMMDFEGHQCCGVESCCDPELHIYSNESKEKSRRVGHVVMSSTWKQCFACEEIDQAVAKNAAGEELFALQEHPWCSEDRYLHKVDDDRWSCCTRYEYQWPVRSKRGNSSGNKSAPVAQIVLRYHWCTSCHPTWIGFRQISATAMSGDEQKLLLGLAIVRLWRTEKEWCGDVAGDVVGCCCGLSE